MQVIESLLNYCLEMKITLLFVGKTSDKYIETGIDKYFKRLKRYIQFDIEVIPALKNTRHLSEAQIKEKESDLILSKLNTTDTVVLLDERGKDLTSLQFADFIQKRMNLSTKNLVFIVGGAYGFSESVYEKASNKLSLSRMTFSHQIIRLIFMEQIYRVFTIINNEPYHHE